MGCVIYLTSYIVPWWGPVAWGQVIPDSTLGLERSEVRAMDAVTEQIEQGARRGDNLFHSFKRFDIDDNRVVQFDTPEGVNRIFSRVTGNDVSDIFGTLKVLGNADLFFLNPNGIIWGPNAQLDINGSLIASTADAIAFDNEGLFSAERPRNNTLLSIQPNAFLFHDRSDVNFTRGSIVHQANRPIQTSIDGSVAVQPFGLSVAPQKTLALLGGDIQIDGGGVHVSGGQVELGSVSDNSRIALSAVNDEYDFNYDSSDISGFGAIRLANQALVSVGGSGEGQINLRGHTVRLQDISTIQSSAHEGISAEPGSVNIMAQAQLHLSQDSRILTHISIPGTGAPIAIATDRLRLRRGGQLQSTTAHPSAIGGPISVDAREMSIVGRLAPIDIEIGVDAPNEEDAGIFSTSTGIGGNIAVTADTIQLSDSAVLVTTATGQNAQGGNVTLDARAVTVTELSFLGTTVGGDGANTRGGNVNLLAEQVWIEDGGKISTLLNGPGNSGNVAIQSDHIQLVGRSASFQLEQKTGIFSETAPNGRGNTGAINLQAEQVWVFEGADISTGNFIQGAAGNIRVNASDLIQLTGDSSTIQAIVKNNQGIDERSQILLSTDRLILANGGIIDASNIGSGQAGNIVINARLIDIDNGFEADHQLFPFSNSTSGIQSRVNISASSASGGKVEVNANRLSIRNGGFISAGSSGEGTDQVGTIVINASHIDLSGTVTFATQNTLPSRIITQLGGPGVGRSGNISIDTDTLRLQQGAQISSNSQGEGAAGTIEVNANRIFLDGVGTAATSDGRNQLFSSGFTTETRASDRGGDIIVNVDEFLLLQNGAQITTNAGTGVADTANRRVFSRLERVTEGGAGGNITLNMAEGVLVSVPTTNSDITANSFDGRGGRISITAAGVVGFIPRTRAELVELLDTDNPAALDPAQLTTNDITSISQTDAALSGEIIITTSADPSRTEELPSGLTDASNQIDQTVCRATQGSEFLVTGRGGIVPSPHKPFHSEDVWEDWRLMDLSEGPSELPFLSSTVSTGEQEKPRGDASYSSIVPHSAIFEAQGWQTTDEGAIILVADAGSLPIYPNHSGTISC